MDAPAKKEKDGSVNSSASESKSGDLDDDDENTEPKKKEVNQKLFSDDEILDIEEA